jgi:prophage tail gpP-like protein
MAGSTYVVENGDTFESIAAKVYGDPSLFIRIQQANYGGNWTDYQVLLPGRKIIIPDLPERAASIAADTIPEKDRNAVTLIIDGKEIKTESIRVRKALDSVADGWTAVIPWIDTIRPFSYNRAQVYVGGKLIVNGVVYGVSPVLGQRREMKLEGFSYSADIVDSYLMGPIFQWYDSTLEQHAKEILRPFGRKAIFEFDGGEAFGVIDAELSTKVFDHLAALSFQRGLLMTSSTNGDIVFTKTQKGNSIGTVFEGDNRVIGWEAAFDGRKRFHSYRAYGYSPLRGDKTIIATDSNVPRSRVMSVSVDDLYSWDIGYAAEWKRSKQVADSINISLPMLGWYAPNNTLWAHNTLLTVVSETLFVPKGFQFLIKSIELIQDRERQIALINIVPPGVYAERGERTEDPWL